MVEKKVAATHTPTRTHDDADGNAHADDHDGDGEDENNADDAAQEFHLARFSKVEVVGSFERR